MNRILGFSSATIILCVLWAPCVPAHGATATWKGGTGDWIRTTDWVEGFEPGLLDDAVFDNLQNGTGGSVYLHQTAADIKIRSVRSITFLPGIGSYLIRNQTGAARKDLLVGEGGIINNSTSLQTFDTEILLSTAQTWSASAGGILAEDVVQLGTASLTLTGSSNITINGAISGSGGIIKEGTGTLTLGAANLYTGSTIVNAGTLAFTSPQVLPGDLVLNGGVLDANDQSLTYSSLVVGGDATLRLGDDGLSQRVEFGDASWLNGILTIQNWDATAGSDQFYIVTEPSATFLGQVQFDGYAQGALWLGGPVVPVPEPSAGVFIAVGVMLLLVTSARRRRRR